MQRCISCTEVLDNIPTCRRCARREASASELARTNASRELVSQKETFLSRIEELQKKSTLEINDLQSTFLSRIEELQRKSSLEINDLQSRLNFLRLNDGMPKADVMIIVQGRADKLLYAHKLVLAAKSPVFSKMLDAKMNEDETGTIRIDDASVPVMQAVIDFLYRAEIDFTDEVTAEEVLAVAHKYSVDFLQKVCENHLITTIEETNLLERLRLAKQFEAKDLQAGALAYFKRHFDEGCRCSGSTVTVALV